MEDMERYLRFYERVRSGENNLWIEVRRRNFRTGDIRWLRLSYMSVPDAAGQPSNAIGTAVDITAEKCAREHLNQAFAATNKVSGGNLAGVLLYNATTGLVIQHDPMDLLDVTLEMGAEVEEGLQKIAAGIEEERDRKHWIEIHDCDNLKNLYRQGEDTIIMECQRRDKKGHRFWGRHEIRVIQEHESGDLIVVAHLYDIEVQKQEQMIMERLFHLDYEMLGVVDLSTECFTYVRKKDGIATIHTGTDAYQEVLKRTVAGFADPKMSETALEEMSLAHILQKLEEKEVYSREYVVFYRNQSCRKRWRFSYLDEKKNFLLAGRMNVEE